MGTLPLSLPTISWEGPWQLMAAPWGAVHGENPEPPADTGEQAMALPVGPWAQRGWAALLVWQGASRRPGSPIPEADAWQQDSAARLRGALNPARGTVSRQPAVS